MPKSRLVLSLICAGTIGGGSAYAGGYGRPEGVQGMAMPQVQGPSSYSYAYGVPSSGGTQPQRQIYGNGFTTPQGLSSYNYGQSGPSESTSATPRNPQGPSFTLNPSGGFSYNYTGPQGSSGFSYNPQQPGYQQPGYQTGAYGRPPQMPPSRAYQQSPGNSQYWQRQSEGNAVPYGNGSGSAGMPPASNDILQSSGNILSGN
jgi:hypothetical protein